MIFNSIEFISFFFLFFFLYWFVLNKNLKFQNLFILLGSYVFYAWWDWRFLSLLIGSSLLTYYLGIAIEKATTLKKRKLLLYVGLIQGIGGLSFFKYFNFFITSFNDALASININADIHTLNIILPLGISFYTFRMMSYLLDIHKKKLKATKDWVVFFAYVAFFPGLSSGPIDKAKLLVPQLEKKRVFDYNQAVDGLRQILWGAFKKIVIANNCASLTNFIFDSYKDLPASTLLIGAFFYAIQLYSDFSGYSDMAIGVARLIGFNITRNFEYPFFAQNIAEFWRRWHISLTSWLTEYVYTPLTIAFRRYEKTGLILAVVINFTICGLWHGANWTFALFGFINGCYFIPLIVKGTINKKKKIAKDKIVPSFSESINIISTFILFMLTLILFRADSISQAFHYFLLLFSKSWLRAPEMHTSVLSIKPAIFFFFVFATFLIEWMQREKEHGLQINFKYLGLRWAVYFFIVFAIFKYAGGEQQFIYFKF